jgi:hypothetical protein
VKFMFSFLFSLQASPFDLLVHWFCVSPSQPNLHCWKEEEGNCYGPGCL